MKSKSSEELLKEGKARCNVCFGIFTLIHKTKTYPNGARLHTHMFRNRRCFGAPIRDSK